MSKDIVKNSRRALRPGYSFEFRGKGIKKLNRKINRKRVKEQDRKREYDV